MSLVIRKLFFIFTFNFTLFLILIIGIQNSSSQKKVDLIISESVKLPVSFIIGVSFISGSLVGSLLNSNFYSKK